MHLKNKILKYKIEIIVIGALGVLLLPFHIYYDMTHLDKSEVKWYQPYEHQDTAEFISNDGVVLRAHVSAALSNRPTWARLNSHFNLFHRPHYVASIRASYQFIDSTFFYNDLRIVKYSSQGDLNYVFFLANRRAEINLDTLHLGDIYMNGVNIPQAFFINESNSKNTYSRSYKTKYRLVDEILWSKPLGLVYFRMADSTEYYRSDIFFGIPIEEKKPD